MELVVFHMSPKNSLTEEREHDEDPVMCPSWKRS